MSPYDRQRFRELWLAGEPLEKIGRRLGYSFQALAKWRMELGLPRRYEPIDLEAGMEEPPPSPDVIRQRCAEVQTAWSVEYRAMVWRGKPGEAYREGSE
jgi:hypothetical protein